jgi:hypothetical protein
MKRTREYRRLQRMWVIKRKARILNEKGGDENVLAWSHGGEIGRFAKGKIHCSCWMCRNKSYDNLAHAESLSEYF